MERAWVIIVVLAVFIPVETSAQPLPEIALDPAIECWYHSDFPVLTALVDPREEIVSSRLYFRCSLYRDYYFVDLTTDGTEYTAVAPQAEETCPRVHYYVEAVTRDFTSSRTPERVADVTSAGECRRRYPAAAFFPGDNPEIVLGSTVAGPQLAPGFKSVGVGAFISASGAVVAGGSAGGGSSAAVVAGVAAAGAGAAGVGVLVGGGSSDTTTSVPAIMVAPPPPPPATTTVAAPPPGPAQDVKACVRFTPIDAIIDEGETLTIDGRCSEGGDALSYRYDLGDGRIKEGQPFITVVYPDPGTYRLTLTVSRATPSSPVRAQRADEDSITRTVRVRAIEKELVANFTADINRVDSCSVEFDGSSSVGDIVDYRWELDVNNDFGDGVIVKNGMIVQHEWFSGCFAAKGMFTVRLTVEDDTGQTHSVQKFVNLFRLLSLDTVSSVESSMMTHLMAAKSAAAQITVTGGRTFPVAGGTRASHRYPATPGTNVLEGVLTAPLDEPAMWRFDFSASDHFVPGSLRLVAGTEVSRDARSIVVRVTGRPGERVRLEYELSR